MNLAADKIWAIVPAAGSSRRMGSHIPKQYLSIMGEPLIEITLKRLLQLNQIQQIVVAISSDDTRFSALPIAKNKQVLSTVGGVERGDSVLAGLTRIEAQAKASDWVLVHDAARCCVRTEIINDLIDSLKEDSIGGILAVPVSDTLKRVNDLNQIESTLDRSSIWQAQTPQLFRYGILKSAIESALLNQTPITDEASAVELAGHTVQVSMGHYDNIKVTHKEDLLLAEIFLKQQLHTRGES